MAGQQALGLGSDLSLAARDDHVADGVVVAVGAGDTSGGHGVGRCGLSCCRVGGDLVRIGPAGIALDVSGRALVLNAQDAIAVDGVHKALGARVHDGGVQARAEGGSQKDRAQQRAGGQAKADVRHAKRAFDAQALLAQGHGAQNLLGLALIGRGGHDQAVDEDAVRADAVAGGLGHDALGDGEAGLGGIGDAAFVERKADDVGAVVGNQRKDLIHDLLLAVDRVDDGLAGVAAYGGLDGGGIGGVDLQRQQRGALELLGRLLDNLDLVDLGQAHVNVQDVGALFLLADALAHDVVQVAVAQGLLQALFAGGIDALADDGNLVAVAGEVHHGLGACDRHAGLAVARTGRVVIDKRAQGGHVRRRGAAAAAHDAHAVLNHAGDGLGVFGCLDIKDGIAVIVHAGQSRIGLHHNGLVRNGEHTRGESSELGRALAAVDAQNVGADGVEGDGGDLGARAQEGAAVFLKGHGGKDGQVGILAAGEDCRLDLGQVGHSLDNKEVHTRGDARAHLLGKEVVGLVEAEGTQGAQQRADGADIAGDVVGTGCAGAGDSGGKDICHGGGTVELVGVGAKGIGGDHVAAGLDVLSLNVGNDLGLLKVEQLGQGSGLHAGRLQHGAHAAVEQQMPRALDGRTQAIVLNAQIVDRARLVRGTVATCGINGCRQCSAVRIMSDKRSKHRGLLMAGIAGGVGGAEATVLAHAADIAGGAALGVVDLAVEQTDHRGHALGGHEQAGGRDGKPDEPRGVERVHD